MSIMVQISELDLSDEQRSPVFAQLHFRLNRGDWAFLTGATAQQRTLLLMLIGGLIQPDRGQILVDDRNIIRVGPELRRQLRQRMGIHLVDRPLPERRSLQTCIALKLRALDRSAQEADRMTGEALRSLELEGYADAPLRDLAPLERARFQLALALCHEPTLLLLEDALEGLDPRDTERYLEALERIYLRKRLTILMTGATPPCDVGPLQLMHLTQAGVEPMARAEPAPPQAGVEPL